MKEKFKNRIVGSGTADPATLTANPKNWRKHPDAQQKAMQTALEKVGWIQDVIVNKTTGHCIDGHLRVEMALRNKEKEIPVKYVELTEEEEKTALATFDPLTLMAEQDDAMLKQLLEECGADVDLSQFHDDYDKLMRTEHTAEELEAVPDMPKVAKTKRGDVYKLGDHVLMCGDSTSEDDIKKLLTIGGGAMQADLCFTSPPYNAGHMDIEGDKTTKKKYLGSDDSLKDSEYTSFLKRNMSLLLKYCDEVFYNISILSGSKVAVTTLMHDYCKNLKDLMFWVKTNATPVIQDKAMNTNVELIICMGNDGKKRFKNAQFSRGACKSYIEGASASSSNQYADIHKATFPPYLPEHIIKNFTAEGQTVMDCFGGTGTTLVVCEELNRKCRMMELEPLYCDVIVERWEKLTGKHAELIREGENNAN